MKQIKDEVEIIEFGEKMKNDEEQKKNYEAQQLKIPEMKIVKIPAINNSLERPAFFNESQ